MPPVFACLPPNQCLVSFLADVCSCLTREPSLWTMWLPLLSWATGWSCCACPASSFTPYAWSWPSPQQRGRTSNRYWSLSSAGGTSVTDPCQKQWERPSFIPLTAISWRFLFFFFSLCFACPRQVHIPFIHSTDNREGFIPVRDGQKSKPKLWASGINLFTALSQFYDLDFIE